LYPNLKSRESLIMLMARSVPNSPAASAALAVAQSYYSPALLNHCIRSYHFAAAAGELEDVQFDAELLFVASILHDLGLVPVFDSHLSPFEEAGGHVAAVFASGAGWSEQRQRRVAETVVRHMADEVDPEQDPEGYLLERATGFDISGRNAGAWPRSFAQGLIAAYPRLDLNRQFAELFEAQAERKPASAAAGAVRSGIRERLTANVLNDFDIAH
jgi:hypothetical protein